MIISIRNKLVKQLNNSALNRMANFSVSAKISEKLTTNFAPSYLDVINESYKHNVPKGSESHFKVVVVSDKFEGKSLVERHRMVNRVLTDELKQSVHALSIQAMTQTQWDANKVISDTPNCMGGSSL